VSVTSIAWGDNETADGGNGFGRENEGQMSSCIPEKSIEN
jgi:hypothetical protein